MTEQTIQAQGDGGVAPQPAQQPAPAVAQPVAQPVQQPVAQPQGFGQGQPANGFAQPVQQPVAQPVAPVETDNTRTREQFEKLTETNQRLATQQDAMKQQYE